MSSARLKKYFGLDDGVELRKLGYVTAPAGYREADFDLPATRKPPAVSLTVTVGNPKSNLKSKIQN